MTALSTHVLDLVGGTPVAGLAVSLDRFRDDAWEAVEGARTDIAGRARFTAKAVERGAYRLRFDTRPYYQERAGGFYYGEIVVAFQVDDSGRSLHLPLLLTSYGYSTYRGS